VVRADDAVQYIINSLNNIVLHHLSRLQQRSYLTVPAYVGEIHRSQLVFILQGRLAYLS
jgi:hypothetical protein